MMKYFHCVIIVMDLVSMMFIICPFIGEDIMSKLVEIKEKRKF